ncbi:MULTISPECIES: ABC transporter ATP-binding protein [Burkholderia]|uniref:sn-glycerol-3-phosphate ABC transporter ATP-binding protein UgpC n=1 Tax=Burkholderia contaminans TaxID=488447 RepID=A0A2S5E4T6_9BURK|nr:MULTISPECIES: sn-glycerol-3-phosphate ABC transporter ATP-binding protein UgpC [Burkholderia]EKS9796013.1 sn-glycerol-3-phosphate ABC transporter ATP-binding protein UgpC [Burkholderia cepacia]EKS9807158.1 sn-glycerol-3-phosphate ABC transporter ATP-binding protein UgpC [Burkholderia cepacia]EKS9810823.1 sn-glycerol-3-phosphate ABC transporter ATP-binding protein UgpC [Burkholderia cepacia]EKS9819337.1 sn-glycerol-3-phosphate ABC transporter ATP-binding protein UgpC [Burkholderia cepacia]EK
MASISMRRVQKAYGDHAPVIRDVDLEIGAHEFCVFLGPSGCGKSTLLRMIAGLEDLSAGELSIDGRRVDDDVPAAERGVAMVFQSYALFPHMTVYENMAFGLKLARVPKAEIDRKVRDAARILQLDTLLDRKPKALSGGQRQRVAIGRAIVREPGVFLFDEPLSNLDAALRGQTRIEIAKLHRQFERASVVYVTHDQTEAMTLADKIVLLHAGADTAQHGSIAQVGAPLDLYHHPASRFVAGFIGSPRMNFLPAVVTACDARRTTVTLTPSGETFVLPRDGSALGAGATVTLGIRPEHLTLGAAHDATSLARDVALVERLGEQTYVHLDQPGGHSIIAKVPGDAQVRSGERVRVHAPAAACHLFTEDGRAVPACADVHVHHYA